MVSRNVRRGDRSCTLECDSRPATEVVDLKIELLSRASTLHMAKRFKFHLSLAVPCPVHHVPMMVQRTVKEVQYRYCPEPGCDESCQTRRPVKRVLSARVPHG